MKLQLAPDIKNQIFQIVAKLQLTHIKPQRIICFRSFKAKARARARIWSLPQIWQQALGQEPHYCLEVLHEKYDCLNEDDRIRVLIHELMHIPKNFSGALLPHLGPRKHKRQINYRTIEALFKKLKTK